MIETVTQYIALYSDYAPIIIFGLLLLTGFSFPISEDIILIATGIIAATLLPGRAIQLFIAAYAGSCASDSLAYWIGRLVGNRVGKYSLTKNSTFLKKQRTFRLFFRKYGALTLFIGRLIPFGIRNGIFMAAGAGKMHYAHFIISDAISCLLFSSTVFYLSYRAGANYNNLQSWINSLGLLVIGICSISLLAYLFWRWIQKQSLDESPKIS
jgi:membrane-associated protein